MSRRFRTSPQGKKEFKGDVPSKVGGKGGIRELGPCVETVV